MTTETLIWLIPLPPLLAFFTILLFTRNNNRLSHMVGVGAATISDRKSKIGRAHV